MSDTSDILSNILPSSHESTTQNAIEALKEQSNQMQRQLLQQEILNTNLYQSLLNSGIIQNNYIRTTSTTTVSNILQVLQGRNLMNTRSELAEDTSIETGKTPLLNIKKDLASILPFTDLKSGFNYF